MGVVIPLYQCGVVDLILSAVRFLEGDPKKYLGFTHHLIKNDMGHESILDPLKVRTCHQTKNDSQS